MLALIRAPVSRRGLPALLVAGRSCGHVVPGDKQTNFKGVHWQKKNSKWLARVSDPLTNRLVVVGQYDQPEDAAFKVDCANLALRGSHAKTNLDPAQVSKKDIDDALRIIVLKRFKKPVSSYRGVRKAGDRWVARIFVSNMERYLGTFDTEAEAAHAYDDALRKSGASKSKLLRALNFKLCADYFDVNTWQAEAVPVDVSSRFMGVTFYRVCGKFAARCGTKQLGYFENEAEAAYAFDAYSFARGGPTNFHPNVIRQSQVACGEDRATVVWSAISDPMSSTAQVEDHTSHNRVLVRSTSLEQQHTKEFTWKATASGIGERREQAFVSAFCKQLAQRGHALEARCYYDVQPNGERMLVGRCDFYDKTTGTLYEAKSKADVPSICMAIGQLKRYQYFERAGGGDASVGLALLLPSDDVEALGNLDRAFLEALQDIEIAVITSRTV